MAKSDRVKMKIDRIPGILEEDVIIAINGVNYQIPRGKTVEVPPFVKAEYDRSLDAQEHLFKTEQKLAYVSPEQGKGGITESLGLLVE